MSRPNTHQQDIPQQDDAVNPEPTSKNVLGTALEPCCFDPLTCCYRVGHCHTVPQDRGVHVVCSVMTDSFLNFTKARGNDLSTPVPAFNFPGLSAGDRWCLCADRWREALEASAAPHVVLAATHEAALTRVSLDDLQAHEYQPLA